MNSHFDGKTPFGEANYGGEDGETVYNRLTTPERDRTNRLRSGYSIRNTRRNNVHPLPAEANEDSNFNDRYPGNLTDATDHDVTTSTEGSQVLGLEVAPPGISCKKLVCDESNIIADVSVSRLESRQNIPKDSMIDKAETGSLILVSGMGLKPLPQWSRHLLHP